MAEADAADNCLQTSSLPEHLPQSLRKLVLFNCPCISLPEDLSESLNTLELSNCPGILSLPEHLPKSLNSLKLINCSDIFSLPEHLPRSLTSIFIRECQILAERCECSNSEEWPKMAHVPNIDIL